MANVHQGEVALEAGSSVWVLKLSARAAASLETIFGTSIIGFLGDIDTGSIRHMAAFLRETSTPPIKAEEAFDIIDELSAEKALAKIVETIKVSGLLRTEKKGRDKNPPKATAE